MIRNSHRLPVIAAVAVTAASRAAALAARGSTSPDLAGPPSFSYGDYGA